MKRDIIYVGSILVLILVSIFIFNMYYMTRVNYDKYKEYCGEKINFAVTHFTSIPKIYNYTSKVIEYSKYLSSKDKNPCNCTKFNSTRFEIRIDDSTHLSMSRDVWCSNEHYLEIISFNYLAPILKNWSEYTPSEICIKE